MSTQRKDTDRSTGLESRVTAEIRAELARRRMQQAELAELLKEDPSWVSRLLGERRRMTVDDLDRIAKALGMRAADLLPAAARRVSQVTGQKTDQPIRTSQDRPKVLAHSSDASPARTDQHRRPRRPIRPTPRMPIMSSMAA